MRIINGNFKGKKLFLPKDKNTRPLKDIVKESIFNLIQHSKKINLEIENSLVLDLFSGTGSFGIECISRGSKRVIFYENYDKAINLKKDYVDAHLNKGISLRILKKYKESISCFKTCIKLKPKEPKIYNNLGNVFKEKGELELSANNYKQAIIIIFASK